MGRNPKNVKTLSQIDLLIHNEGWELLQQGNSKTILAYGQEFPYAHPAAIHNKIYRTAITPEDRYKSMVAVHNYYWPHLIKTWNYWEEGIYWAHCEGWKFISLAAGASAGKSHTVGKLTVQNFLADPQSNAAIVASTTLQSLKKRVFGYIISLLHQIQIPIHFHFTKTPTPQVLFDTTDEIHSISALAAGVGTDEESIKDYIGRHPKKRLMLILDEAPNLSPVVLKSVANLEAGELDNGESKLQVFVIGNSKTKSDLHGALSTPKKGWASVSPKHDTKWLTTQDKGVCLYFSPYRSPAITDPDPVRRKTLGQFLPTLERIEAARKQHGENSIEFHRMTLGFWQDSASGESTFTTEPFLNNFNTKRHSLWSGLHPLRFVGGFNPAFSTGGDKAVLRLAVLGHSTNGQVVLDYRDSSLLFKLKMFAQFNDPKTGEPVPLDMQLANQIIDILLQFNMSLEDVTFDVTGQGRTFPELVRMTAVNRGIHWRSGLKIWHARSSGINSKQPDCIVRTPTELWDNLKDYIQTNQIAGLDDHAIYQLTSRLLVFNPKTKKRELESKLDYRNRMNAITPGKGTSPDEADAAALCLFTATYRHGFYKEQVRTLEDKPDFFTEKYNLMKREREETQKMIELAPIKASYTGEMGVKLKGPWQ